MAQQNSASEEDECHRLGERVNEIGSLLHEIDDGLNTWSPAILSKAGAIISLKDGTCDIERGLVKGKLKVDKDTRAAKSETKAKEIAKGGGHSIRWCATFPRTSASRSPPN
jgi:hypothetical protein